MILKEKEMAAIKDLQTQEEMCIKKYDKYSKEAKDPVLKDLFKELKTKEEKHYQSLQQVIDGTVPECNCNDDDLKSKRSTISCNCLPNSIISDVR